MSLGVPWLAVFAAMPLLAFAVAVFRHRRTRVHALGLSRLPLRGGSWLAPALAVLAALVATAAATLPRWGSEDVETVRRGAQVVFVLDVSRSMDARDEDPSRLVAARDAVDASLAALEGDQAAVVVFGGTAYLRSPMSQDLSAVRAILTSIEAGQLFVEGGSSIAAGLTEAALSFESGDDASPGRLVVLISDGDDQGLDPLPAATALRSAGIDIIVAGVGSPEGAPVPFFDRATGELTEDPGAGVEPVVSALNESLLFDVARAGGGRYVGEDLGSLPGVVAGRVSTLEQSTLASVAATVPIERYLPFAAAALGLAILAVLAEALPRFRARYGAFATVVLLGGCATAAYNHNERGLQAFETGDTDLAVSEFRLASDADPSDLQLSLNLAAAYLAAGEFEDAELTARRATTADTAPLRALGHSAIGHARFEAGDLEGALEAFRLALREDPVPSHRHNYEVVLRLLTPPPSPTPAEPGPTPTPGDGGTPTDGSATPGGGNGGEPGVTGTPGAGAGTPQPGWTPTPGEPGSPTGGDTSGQAPSSVAEIDNAIASIDQRISDLQPGEGEQLSPSDREALLDLLEERARLAALREVLRISTDPADY